MANRPRPDLRPRIVLPDTTEDQKAAGRAISPHRRAMVFDANTKLDEHFRVFDHLITKLNVLRRRGVTLDEGLMYWMMARCDIARAADEAPSADEKLDGFKA